MSRQILIDPAHEDGICTAKQHGKDPNEIGNWRVGRVLGAGANGRVRIARNTKSGDYAAIKIFSKKELDLPDADPVEVQRVKTCIMREITLMKLLHHPNILQMYEACITRGNYYLILEFVDGKELYEVLGDIEGVLPLHQALDYFQQIISALVHCHRYNVAHRDLKPENILLCKDGVIKLADFGLAGWVADDRRLETQCGSPHYLSPEVILAKHKPYDGRVADIWSAGVVLFSLLTNKVPFNADDHNELFELIVTAEIVIPVDVHPSARHLLPRMLNRDLDQRYTVNEVQVHPVFDLVGPYKPIQGPTFEELARPLPGKGDIDSKLFGNLRHLWPATPPHALRNKLVDAEKTWEQAAYHLLLRHRARKEEEDVAFAKRAKVYQARKAAERAERKAMKYMRRAAINRPTTPLGVLDIPPRADPPTPRRASGSRSPTQSEDGPSPMLLNPYDDNESPSPMSPDFPRTPYSPRWEELDLPGIPDVQKLRELCRDPRWSEFFDAVEEHVASGKILQPAGPRPTMNAARRVSDRMKAPFRTKPLAIRRSVKHKPPPLQLQQGRGLGLDDVQERAGLSSALEENDPLPEAAPGPQRKSTLKKAGIENRRPHSADPRHVRINDEPTWHTMSRRKSEPFEGNILRRRRSSQMVSADSPGLRSPISPAWFTGLFKKAPTCEFLSAHDEKTTRAECERILATMGVSVELTRHDALGVLKCRIDEHQDHTGAIVKSLRFRVEVQPATQVQAIGGFNSFALLELEKGTAMTFRGFCTKLRLEWDLDVPQLPEHEMSPEMNASFQMDDGYVDEVQY